MQRKYSRRVGICTLVPLMTAVGSATSDAANITWNTTSGTWNTSLTNWTGDATTFTDGGVDNVNFTTTGGTITVVDNMSPASISVNSGSSYTFFANGSTGVQIDSGSLTKSGSGSLGLQIKSSSTGVTSVFGGILQAEGNNNGSGTPALADGGVNSSIGASSAAASNLVISGGQLTVNKTGTSTNRLFTIGSTATIRAALSASFTGTGAIEFTAPNQASTLSFTSGNNQAFSFAPQLTDNGSGKTSLNISANNFTLAGTSNTHSGTTDNSANTNGTLTVTKLANFNQASSIGQLATNDAAAFKMGGGTTASFPTLKYIGGGDSTNRNFTVQASTNRTLAIDASGSGALQMSGAITYSSSGSGTAFDLNFTGSSSANLVNSFAGAISNPNGINSNAVTMSVNKTGANTWKISGNNNYNGNTTVSGGTLLVDGGLINTTRNNASATSGSTTVTIPAGSLPGLIYGAYVSGTGIAPGTRITNISTNTNTITLDTPTNAPISSGTVLSFVTGSGTGTGAVNVNAGTLGGSGTIWGNTTIASNATLSPGSSAGLLTFSNALVLNAADSKLNFELASGTRGTNYDAVNVGGALTYNGDLSLLVPSSLTSGTYNLFDFGSQTGNFDSILFSGAGPYSGTFTNGGGGNWSASSGGATFAFSTSTGDLTVTAAPVSFAALSQDTSSGTLRGSVTVNGDAPSDSYDIQNVNIAGGASSGHISIGGTLATSNDAPVLVYLDFANDADAATYATALGFGTTGAFNFGSGVTYDLKLIFNSNPNLDGGFEYFNFDTNGLIVNNIGVVPEPATIGLLAIGGLGMLRRRRRVTSI